MVILSRTIVLSTLILCSTRRLNAFQRLSGAHVRVATRSLTRNSATATNGQVASRAVGETFTSDPMRVFIEDTDAYGVVYNGNYLKFYDRALHQVEWSLADGFCHDNVMVSVGNQKFRSSPSLGDEFIIEGVVKEVNEEQKTWDLSLKSLDGSKVYHSAAGVVVTTPQNEEWLADVDAFAVSDSTHKRIDSFVAYRDEFDPSMSSHLPLQSVLNHMERPRSNFFGGPQELRRLQEEDGIVVVVSGIKNLCLLEHKTPILVGDRLTVKTVCDVRKGGMRTDMYQTLFTSTGERLAQGIVTVLCLNKETYRPTSKLPQRILDNLASGGEK